MKNGSIRQIVLEQRPEKRIAELDCVSGSGFNSVGGRVGRFCHWG
jgi:hypothetical protein